MISGRKGGHGPVDAGGLHHESTPTTTFCALASRSRNQARTVPTRQAVTPAPSFTGEGNLASFTIRHKVVPEKGSTLPRSCAWRTKALSGSLSNWCMLAGSTGCNRLHFAYLAAQRHRQEWWWVFMSLTPPSGFEGLQRYAQSALLSPLARSTINETEQVVSHGHNLSGRCSKAVLQKGLPCGRNSFMKPQIKQNCFPVFLIAHAVPPSSETTSRFSRRT